MELTELNKQLATVRAERRSRYPAKQATARCGLLASWTLRLRALPVGGTNRNSVTRLKSSPSHVVTACSQGSGDDVIMVNPEGRQGLRVTW